MSLNLPRPIQCYFNADREAPEEVAACFTPDALVQDEGHLYRGTSEIRRWKEEAAAKYTYTCEPLFLDQQGDATVVTSRLEGNFPGSPANLRFLFQLAGDKIASLEVTP